MRFEQPPIPEDKAEKIFSLSKDEFERLRNLKTEDPEDISFMEEKGISFDSGDIVIEIDGKKEMMTTRKDDFGTLVTPETIEERYGKEKRDMIEKQ
jgi:hypothetical protein